MEWYWITAIAIGLVVLLMGVSVPVVIAFFTVSAIGAFYLSGEPGLEQIADNAPTSISSYAFVPIPLFLLMGELFFHTGVAVRVFDAFDALFGRLPGRLSYVTVAGGTAFAALSGNSMGNTAMLGSLMVPEMTKRGYKKHMSMGPILGVGGLAMIIPPSGLGVLLGSLARVDIGKLLIAGVFPGLILAVLYTLLIYVQVRIDPDAAPQYDVERVPWSRRLWLIATQLLPMGVVIFAVIGLIVLGIATPEESAAFGVLGVLLLAAFFRTLTWQSVIRSLTGALRVTCMVLIIVIASYAFTQVLALSGATGSLVDSITTIQAAPLALLLIMFAVLLVMGMFMDVVSIMLLTIPIFFPLAISLGYDPVWFGIVMLLTLEISMVTPPFGLGLFVMLGVAPKDTTLGDVAKAAAPYVACDLILFCLLVIFPSVALFLPSLME